ncbi:hypothetical protein [Providencia stuartii]|nr:hypothetical protein [Providencia stuartii]MCX3072565.1 hypothetical protein [Providencia stuartii]
MNYAVGGGGLFGLIIGFLILYLIYFLLAGTLNIISNLFKENKDEKDKDI